MVLAEQYKNEFADDFEQIKQRMVAARNMIASKADAYRDVKLQKDIILSALKDKSPTGRLDFAKMTSTYMWIGVLLLGATMGSIIGAMVPSIVSLLINRFSAFMVAYIILPAAAWYYLQKPVVQDKKNDLFRRHALLGISIIEGLLTGFVLSDLELAGNPSPPLAAITPLGIGFSSLFGSQFVADSRMKLLGLTLGSGMMLHGIMGSLLGLSMTYLLLVLLYTDIGFVSLQVYIRNVGKDASFTHLYQLFFVYGVILSQLLVYGLFGEYRNP